MMEFAQLQDQAEKGNPLAQTAIALLYELGLEVPQDLEQAARFMRMAADQGHGPAALNLIESHDLGAYALSESELNNYKEVCEKAGLVSQKEIKKKFKKQTTQTRSHYIMVADASSESSSLLCSSLKTDGYITIKAADGIAALEHIRTNNKIEMVLLDLNLPRLKGLQLLELIRQDVGLFNLPVILFSDSKSPRELQKAKKLGIYACLSKPLNVLEVRAHVGRYFDQLDKVK